ncbi:MAG TPA: hypothetical protein VF656_00660 [Pyrinomonadaceae bacterium]|jgi:hypothetical protein
MKFLSALKVLSVFLVIFPFQASKSQELENHRWDNGIGHSSWDMALAKEEREKLLQLWDSIGEDLKTERNELAGTYVKGGYDAGYFFRWSVNKGYVLIPYFDQNLITDFSYGKVDFVGHSEVNFTPERDLNGGRSIGKMPRKWTAISGYFVPVEMLKDVGDYMAGFGEYNEFNGQCCEFRPNFLARRIDRPDVKFDYPVSPAYAKFIKQPVEAEITFVGRKKTVKDWGYQGELYGQWMERAVLIPVKISAGRAHGVKPNMLFRLIGEPNFYQYLHVMRVYRRTASGYIVRDISGNGKETYTDYETNREKPLPPIKVGTKVTTSPVRN